MISSFLVEGKVKYQIPVQYQLLLCTNLAHSNCLFCRLRPNREQVGPVEQGPVNVTDYILRELTEMRCSKHR